MTVLEWRGASLSLRTGEQEEAVTLVTGPNITVLNSGLTRHFGALLLESGDSLLLEDGTNRLRLEGDVY
jgi:hypothetical protein